MTRRTHRPTLATLAAGSALMLWAGCAAVAPRSPLQLTILHTNDHHGRFWPGEAVTRR